jgi:hypothetical protein
VRNYNVSLYVYVDIPNTHMDTVYTQALYAIFPGDFPDKIMYIVFVSYIRDTYEVSHNTRGIISKLTL